MISVNNDDGLSQSKNNIDKIKIEQERYDDAFEKSCILHKYKINTYENGTYRNVDNVVTEILKIINQTKKK